MKKLLVLLLATLMAVCWVFNVSAVASPIDLNTKGSLMVEMSCSHGYASDGKVAIYHIANLVYTGTEYDFEYTEDFKNCPIPIDSVWDNETALAYGEYIKENQIMVERTVLNNGFAVVEDVSLGLYLVVHEEPTNGFSAALPFLVTVPVANGDSWEYNVEATPKVELVHGQVTPPVDIPQTGQLKWPIPVMIATGVIIFAIGLVLCFKRSKN